MLQPPGGTPKVQWEPPTGHRQSAPSPYSSAIHFFRLLYRSLSAGSPPFHYFSSRSAALSARILTSLRSSTMEAAAICRSFPGALGFPESHKASFTRISVAGSTLNKNGSLKGVAKASLSTGPSKLDSEKTTVSVHNKNPFSVFPDGFERLVMEVCDETEVAEVKVKVGEYEMHLKRNVDAPKPAPTIASPTVAPPIPSEAMITQLDSTSPIEASQESSPKTSNHFANISPSSAAKLAALEASVSDAFVTVSSPNVGLFRTARTVKGKKQRPCCKQGDMISEGQVIGYIAQFDSELPAKSDVAGEVLKVLFKDGEAVGYGDPLIAVLPSFHGINK